MFDYVPTVRGRYEMFASQFSGIIQSCGSCHWDIDMLRRSKVGDNDVVQNEYSQIPVDYMKLRGDAIPRKTQDSNLVY
jgi:hypothetical protein